MEIERKWLLKRKPEGMDWCTHAIIFQSYLADGDVEVRIRQSIADASVTPNDRTFKPFRPYKMTIKGNGNLARAEIEIEIPKEKYDALLPLAKGKPILKDYWAADFRWSDRTLKLEVSEVDQSWWYAEIEFKSEEEARAFPIPSWLEKVIDSEVTEEPYYKMKNYWRRTRGGE